MRRSNKLKATGRRLQTSVQEPMTFLSVACTKDVERQEEKESEGGSASESWPHSLLGPGTRCASHRSATSSVALQMGSLQLFTWTCQTQAAHPLGDKKPELRRGREARSKCQCCGEGEPSELLNSCFYPEGTRHVECSSFNLLDIGTYAGAVS